MQYSNPWSCSMGGWLISSGFTSAISPDEFCPLGPRQTGGKRKRALVPQAPKNTISSLKITRPPHADSVSGWFLRASSAGPLLTKQEEESKAVRCIEMKRIHRQQPPFAGAHQDEICWRKVFECEGCGDRRRKREGGTPAAAAESDSAHRTQPSGV